MIRRISKGITSRYNADKEQWEHGERFSVRTDDKAMDYTVWWLTPRSQEADDYTHAYYLSLFESKIRMNEKQSTH